jgi:hypothetical protein
LQVHAIRPHEPRLLIMALAAAAVVAVMFLALASRVGDVTVFSGGQGGAASSAAASVRTMAPPAVSAAITHPFRPLVSGVPSPFTSH